MKPLLIILFSILTLSVRAQEKAYTIKDLPFEIDSTTGKMVFRGVVELPGVTSDQLYTRAKAFLFKTFTNAEAVIQVDDKSGGLLAGKGFLRPAQTGAMALMGGDIKYFVPIEIRIKDGKYRYELTNIEMWSGGMRMPLDYGMNTDKFKSKPISESRYQKYLKSYMPFMTLIDDLKLAMGKASGKEDW